MSEPHFDIELARKKSRRTAIYLGLLAAAFFFGFILMVGYGG